MEMNSLLARLLWSSDSPNMPAFSYDEAKRLASHPDPEVRRSLAARTDVVPEVLYFLTSDPDPEVRRRIAANASSPRLADLKLANDDDTEVRADVARKIARLAPGLTADEQDKVRQMTYGILETLARDQLPKVRHILADALKSAANAPPDVIRRLAHDFEIIVAAPILEFSPVLTDTDLLDIIQSSPIAGALSAISRRRDLGERVSDTIANSADVEAIAELLANDSAQLREDTLDALVVRARHLPRLHEPLVRRPHLPHGAARRLATFVAENLLTVLAARHDLAPEAIAAVRRVVHERLSEHPAAENPAEREIVEIEAELEKARVLFHAGQLGHDLIARAINENHQAFVKAALAVAADLSVGVVLRLLHSSSAKAVIALAWRAGLPMDVAILLQSRVARIAPDAILHGMGHAYPLTEGEMAMQIAVFTND